MIESSIVIPVYNKWELTEACLKSIAAHTDIAKIEVIVVDNASTDGTREYCSLLGKQLFGAAFHYARNPENRNFAGASNQGAELANGAFVLFLNNDTEVQPGWYQPLIDDFSAYPNLAATGPLLVYPTLSPLGRTIQHLGTVISPIFQLAHLYSGIPVASPLVRRRRFFQAITAACLVVRKDLFLEVGKFDEKFINGFEDVDLCARLCGLGYQLTVNPDSIVVHYESQTTGRLEHEEANGFLLMKKSLFSLLPDWHMHADRDKLLLRIDEWLQYQIMLPEKTHSRLGRILQKVGAADVRELVITHPFYQQAWEKLLCLMDDEQEKAALFKVFFKLFPTIRNAFTAYALGTKISDVALMNQGISLINSFISDPDTYLVKAKQGALHCAKIGLKDFEVYYQKWIDNFEIFKQKTYLEFAQEAMQL